METYVLIPRQMRLVASMKKPSIDISSTDKSAADHQSDHPTNSTAASSPTSSDNDDLLPTSSDRHGSKPLIVDNIEGGNVGLNEAATRVAVFASEEIEKGTAFFPFQGNVCFAKISCGSTSGLLDRRRLGLYDKTEPQWTHHSTALLLKAKIDDVLPHAKKLIIRRCNWLVFLKISSVLNPSVNLIARSVGGQPMFEAIENVPPNVELVAYVDHTSSPPSPIEAYRMDIGRILKDGPIDLSRQLLYLESDLTNNKTRPINRGHQRMPVPSSISPRQCFQHPRHFTSDSSNTEESPFIMNGTRARNRSGSRACRVLLPCQVCAKEFDRPSLLKRHMRTHTGEKPHVCDVCDKAFSTSSSLNTHRRIHSGERPHQCSLCGKRFTASSNLYYHRMTHSKDKPYKCRVCHKSFSTPGDLRSHAYVHSGAWPYRCSQCHRGFSKINALRNHVTLHRCPGSRRIRATKTEATSASQC